MSNQFITRLNLRSVVLPAAVRHGLPDPVQHQLHLPAHPPLQPHRATRPHGHPEEGPRPLQVGVRQRSTFRNIVSILAFVLSCLTGFAGTNCELPQWPAKSNITHVHQAKGIISESAAKCC